MLQLAPNNFNGNAVQMVDLHVSYSTADIEQTVFFGTQHAPTTPLPTEPTGAAVLLVVNGELFALDEGTTPAWPPLTEHSGLFELAADSE